MLNTPALTTQLVEQLSTLLTAILLSLLQQEVMCSLHHTANRLNQWRYEIVGSERHT
jgi:hypothetical protein